MWCFGGENILPEINVRNCILDILQNILNNVLSSNIEKYFDSLI